MVNFVEGTMLSGYDTLAAQSGLLYYQSRRDFYNPWEEELTRQNMKAQQQVMSQTGYSLVRYGSTELTVLEKLREETRNFIKKT